MGCYLQKGAPGVRSRERQPLTPAPSQACLLPLIFSGLEEKTNSTEAWKGNLSSVGSGR